MRVDARESLDVVTTVFEISRRHDFLARLSALTGKKYG
jgi:hypothetical protein